MLHEIQLLLNPLTLFLKKKMNFLKRSVVGTFLLSISLTSCLATSKRTAVVGTSVSFFCNSSFPMPWSKIGPKHGDFVSLAYGENKHPNFKDSRFTFSKNGILYKISIENLVVGDSGNYRCDGDKQTSYLLSVVR